VLFEIWNRNLDSNELLWKNNMILKVNPNRMELLRLHKRLALAKRGHKLLKDKQNELVKRLLDIIGEINKRRANLKDILQKAYGNLLVTKASLWQPLWMGIFISPDVNLEVRTTIVPIMNLRLPKFEYLLKGNPNSYSWSETPASMHDAVSGFRQALGLMIGLSQYEKWVYIISKEVEKTRRRVNVLEYILIPNLKETIKSINMKLSELERGNIVRMLKIKELVE